MAFEMDFVADVTTIFRARLAALGYHLPADVTDEGARIRYFNLQHRIIARRPRTIHRATALTCPPEVQEGFALLEIKIANGEELRPHLSRGLLNIDYSDGLLNDWGIYHFHLGTALETDGFIARTGPLLFARITEDDAYLLDIRAHGSWTSRSLLQTAYANWPGTLDRFRLRGVVGLRHPSGEGPPTDAQIAAMRRANINVLHELSPRCVYAPAGGGYATDGTSVNVVRANDALVKFLRDTQAVCATFENQLRSELRREDNSAIPDPVRVRLIRRDNGDLVARVGEIAEMTVGHLEVV